MNRTIFILLFVLQTVLYIIWEQLGYSFGSVFIFAGTMALVYFRRRYLQMKPYWAGNLTDIPRYFKLP